MFKKKIKALLIVVLAMAMFSSSSALVYAEEAPDTNEAEADAEVVRAVVSENVTEEVALPEEIEADSIVTGGEETSAISRSVTALTSSGVNRSVLSGFQTETVNGRSITVYYENGVKVTGQRQIDGYWYMFRPDTGEMVTGFYAHSSQTNPNGGAKICYYDENGHLVYGQREIDGYWYMFRPGSGAMVTGFYNHNAQTNPNGGAKTCYYDENGHLVYGQRQIGGYWYMFRYGSGAMVTGFYNHNARTNPNGGAKTCYYDADGHLVYGQRQIGGYWYMFQPGSGAMVTGFYHHTSQTNPNGGAKTCYYDADGHLVYGQRQIGGYWYMFQPGSGAMVTGFYNHTAQTNPNGGAKTCYYDANGHMVYGQRCIGGYWYMFQYGGGAMVRGFYEHTAQTNPNGGAKICYYDENGHMVYGRQTIDGISYRFHESSGALISPRRPVTPRSHIVCIDAGHQSHVHSARIPEGPGAAPEDNNIGVTVGASSPRTGLMEYELNLQIALLLQQRLEEAGIGVVMIRTTNDVDITNDERARIANESGADISIHIHADSLDNSSVRGAHCIIISKDNPYNAYLYEDCRELATCVMTNYISATGFPVRYYKQGGLNEMDVYPMLNWSEIPTCLIEMGFMSNPEEDALMSDPDFQNTMVDGIFNGIMEYYGLN